MTDEELRKKMQAIVTEIKAKAVEQFFYKLMDAADDDFNVSILKAREILKEMTGETI